MTRRKVCVVVTARPSYSRIRSVLKALDDRPEIDLQLVVGASALLERYGRVEKQIEDDGLSITARVSMVLEGDRADTMAKTTGLGVIELSTVFDQLKPDVVVTVADRFETMATAIAAAYMQIPLAHIQGGEVTGSIDERVRHAITKLSDLHFPATDSARQRLERLGERPDQIFQVGCPSIDIAREVKNSVGPNLSFDPVTEYGGVGGQINATEPYVVVLQHPVTNEADLALEQISMVLEVLHDMSIQVLWFWPNVDAGSDSTSKGMRIYRDRHPESRIRFFRNMSPSHFLELLIHSRCIIGNSSVAIRECEFLGVPAVDIGSRQNDRERGGNVESVEFNRDQIRNAIISQSARGTIASASLFGDGYSGERIAEILSTATLSSTKKISY